MAAKPVELNVPRIEIGKLTVSIVSKSAFVHNRLSEKARREFLLPEGRRRTSAERALRLKHNPLEEFRNSAYTIADPQAPTLLGFPAPALKGCLCTAALDLPGTRKTELGRLCWVEGYTIPLWGVPALFMAAVRSADIQRTPDIRTRCAVRDWCADVTICYLKPKLTAAALINILFAGGLLCGIGDGRQEKGKLSFGQFIIVMPDMKEEWATYLRIKAEGARKAQEDVMRSSAPPCFDAETEELFEWFNAELDRRGTSLPPANDADDDENDEDAA